jgi:hypothetical protein
VWVRIDGLPNPGVGHAGELRDWLNSLVLSGSKRATAKIMVLDGGHQAVGVVAIEGPIWQSM